MIVAMIPAKHCWFYDSGFNLNKGLHTLLILPTSVYDIDLSILCIDIHTHARFLLKYLNLNLNRSCYWRLFPPNKIFI